MDDTSVGTQIGHVTNHNKYTNYDNKVANDNNYVN